jgi:hypothetical protein
LTAQQKVQSGTANLGLLGLQQATDVLNKPFNYTGPDVQTSLGQPGALKYDLDMSGVARMPVNAGMTGQQAIMNRLQPQIAQDEAAMTQRLANQGITPGSEAYNNAMRTQGEQKNDLYSQAALQDVLERRRDAAAAQGDSRVSPDEVGLALGRHRGLTTALRARS